MQKQLYSFPLGAKIEAQLPKNVLIALHMSGWNAFGIYELVKREIAAEKRVLKARKKVPNVELTRLAVGQSGGAKRNES